MHKPAITQVPIDATIANRWSGRAYDANQSVSQAQVLALLEAARWAPSCFGDQPWRFLVWNKADDAAGWQQAFDCIVPGNQSWVKDAPVLILVTASQQFSHNGQENRWAEYDTGAAALNLSLQASAMGLMAHQMGGFDANKTRETFAIPETFNLMAMLSVGYPADITTLSGEVLAREQQERKRRPLGELFFAGQWGKPAA